MAVAEFTPPTAAVNPAELQHRLDQEAADKEHRRKQEEADDIHKRQKELDEIRYQRIKELLIYVPTVLIGAGAAYIVIWSSQPDEFKRQAWAILLLLIGAFVGYLTGQATKK